MEKVQDLERLAENYKTIFEVYDLDQSTIINRAWKEISFGTYVSETWT